eukprot:2672632-Alexandrium_andersonii.AAC.1
MHRVDIAPLPSEMPDGSPAEDGQAGASIDLFWWALGSTEHEEMPTAHLVVSEQRVLTPMMATVPGTVDAESVAEPLRKAAKMLKMEVRFPAITNADALEAGVSLIVDV